MSRSPSGRTHAILSLRPTSQEKTSGGGVLRSLTRARFYPGVTGATVRTAIGRLVRSSTWHRTFLHRAWARRDRCPTTSRVRADAAAPGRRAARSGLSPPGGGGGHPPPPGGGRSRGGGVGGGP